MPEFDWPPIVKVGACGLYRPGHAAHVIQARLRWREDNVREVELVEIAADAIVIHHDAQILRLLHHDLDGFRELVRGGYESVHLTSDATLLTLGIGGGYLSTSVRPDDGEPLEPCSSA